MPLKFALTTRFQGLAPLTRLADGVLPLDEPTCGRPTHARRVSEKSLETFVSLHFEAITGCRPVRIVTSRAMHSDPDVVALDEFGRVHVMELKKSKVTEADVKQAEQYMLRFGFADPIDYLADWNPDRAFGPLLQARPADYMQCLLLGLWADLDPGKLGFETIRKDYLASDESLSASIAALFGNRPPSKAKWQDRLREKRLDAFSLVLHSAASARIGPAAVPPLEWFAEQAELMARRCGVGEGRTPSPVGPISRPGLVLWVGAPTVEVRAIGELHRLREIGVDARAFECDVQLVPASQSLWLRLACEDEPRRADLELRTREAITDRASLQERVRIHWDSYVSKAPSARNTGTVEALDVTLPVDSGAGSGEPGTVRHVPFAKLFWGAEPPEIVSRARPVRETARNLGMTTAALTRLLHSSAERLLELPGPAQVLPNRTTAAAWVSARSWGRCGVSLPGPWKPGLFVGFLEDGTDHGVLPSEAELGLDLCVVVDADLSASGDKQSYYEAIVTSGRLDRLIARLRASLQGWDILDVRTLPGKPNRWHPLHLRRPLCAVVRGVDSEEDRITAILSAAREALQLTTSGGELLT